jgi:hypothetical protein
VLLGLADERVLRFEEIVADRNRLSRYAAKYATHEGGEKPFGIGFAVYVTAKGVDLTEPRRIWWARPRKLCALERPGGGGRSHRPERRGDEIEYLKEAGVRVVISLMQTRHNIDAYREAGLEAIHLPVAQDADGLLEAVEVLRRETRKTGAVAIHANRYTDFIAAVCAEHLLERRGTAVEESLERAIDAGLVVTANAAALVEADPTWAAGLPDTPAGHPAYF